MVLECWAMASDIKGSKLVKGIFISFPSFGQWLHLNTHTAEMQEVKEAIIASK